MATVFIVFAQPISCERPDYVYARGAASDLAMETVAAVSLSVYHTTLTVVASKEIIIAGAI